MRALHAACLALLPALALLPGQAAALDAPQLSWSAPADCPDADFMRARIDALLGEQTRAEASATVHASGVVTSVRGGYRLALTVKNGDASGARRLQGTDCSALSETAAWLIAVTIDPNVPEGGNPPKAVEPTAVTVVEPVSPPTPAVKPVPPVTASRESPWSVHGSLFGGVADLRLLQTQAQLGGSLGLSYRQLSSELRYAYTFLRDVGLGERGTAHSTTQSFALATCALWGGRFYGGPCASLSLERAHAESRGVQNPRESTKLWGAVSLGLQAAVRLPRRFELFAEGGILGPISRRPAFTFNTQETTVMGPVDVGFYARLGARYRWALSPRVVQ